MMDIQWQEVAKLMALTVVSGVVTALALQITTGYLEAKAKAAAKVEMENILLLTAQKASTPQPAPSKPSPPEVPFIDSRSYLTHDNSGIGYPSVIP